MPSFILHPSVSIIDILTVDACSLHYYYYYGTLKWITSKI